MPKGGGASPVFTLDDAAAGPVLKAQMGTKGTGMGTKGAFSKGNEGAERNEVLGEAVG